MTKMMSDSEFAEMMQSPAAMYASACNKRDVLEECNAVLRTQRDELVQALQAFADRATKLSGHPAQYDPYLGELVKARAALARVRT